MDIERLNHQDIDIGQEIRRLNDDNEELRQKTIVLLKSTAINEDIQERRRLEEYIRK